MTAPRIKQIIVAAISIGKSAKPGDAARRDARASCLRTIQEGTAATPWLPFSFLKRAGLRARLEMRADAHFGPASQCTERRILKRSLSRLCGVLVAAGYMGMISPAAAATPPWKTLPVTADLPPMASQGYVQREGARIWFGSIGKGSPVILLHGGMASSRSWGNQIAPLLHTHHRIILIDSRGHGRSTLGDQPLTYERMAGDVLAVMDHLGIDKTAVVGWSDGAIVSLVLAMQHPQRLTRIYAFGANMDQSAVRQDAFDAPVLKQVVARLASDYAALSPTPDEFGALHQAIEAMQKSEPNYTADQLAAIHGPRILVADGAHDEFIKPEHQIYLSHTIPGARLKIFANASHFAPWQQPDLFNASMLKFLDS